jgi:hypothetical protein
LRSAAIALTPPASLRAEKRERARPLWFGAAPA